MIATIQKRFKTEDILGLLNSVEQKYAPETLFMSGDLGILSVGARVAIVGSRKASPEGLARAKKLATLLVSRSVNVVSGLASGIDTAAHTACLNAGGRTIAVIGTPLSGRYPKENASLQEKIMREHLCISQFVEGRAVGRQNFPIRNRTMALLSDATVIIEASDTSGSLHQGWEALRLGRGLFITKAVAEDTRLMWPAKMQNYGAKILSDETIEDLFDQLPLRQPSSELENAAF